MVADVRRHFESVRASYGPDVPFFVLGESMGATGLMKLEHGGAACDHCRMNGGPYADKKPG
eukprot:23843-Eustigmatos_ZCMA.PRE.1